MKKVLSLIAVLLCMGLTACGNSPEPTPEPAPAPAPAPEAVAPAENPPAENPPAEDAPADAPDEVPEDDDSWEKIRQKGEFVMGLSTSYPPASFIDDSGEIVGFEIDFAGEVCKRLGIKLVKHEIVWEEKEDDLALGKIDCIWSAMSVTPEREKSMYLSEPYMRNNLVMIASPESGIHSLDDIYGKTIGVPDSSTSKDLLEKEYGSDIYLTSIQDNSDVLRQLKLGVVDAVCMDSIVANYWNATNGGGYTVFPVTEDSETYAIAFRKVRCFTP